MSLLKIPEPRVGAPDTGEHDHAWSRAAADEWTYQCDECGLAWSPPEPQDAALSRHDPHHMIPCR